MDIAIRILLFVVSVVLIFFVGDLMDRIGKRWTDSSWILTILNITVTVLLMFGIGFLLRDLVGLLKL